jgi:hypothetical protein
VGNKRIDAGPRFWNLEVGICLGFGIWDLGFLCNVEIGVLSLSRVISF